MVVEDVNSSKVVSGMLQSADIASSIMTVLSIANDVDKTEALTQSAKNIITGYDQTMNLLNSKFNLTGESLVMNAYSDIQRFMPTILDNNKNATYYGRLGWQCAAKAQGATTKLYAQQNLLDTSFAMIFDQREAILRHKSEEYWLSVYKPANPSEALIVQQYIRGNCTAKQAAHYLAIRGVPDTLAMWLYDAGENYPSIREMAIASQITPITDTELNANMKYSNITLQKNKDFFLNYAHALQLRTELNQYLVQLRADYNAGLMSEEELTAEIAEHKPNPNEQAQIIENCNKQRTRTLLNMEIQSRTWLYRKGIFGAPATDGEAETAFYFALIEVNMEPLFANSLARFEACKLGYNWERV